MVQLFNEAELHKNREKYGEMFWQDSLERQKFTKLCKLPGPGAVKLDSDTEEHDEKEEDGFDGDTEFDEVPNEESDDDDVPSKDVICAIKKCHLLWTPTRETCQASNCQASAKQQTGAQDASLTRNCRSESGCGRIFCYVCYP
jgi:hypothetical protein